MTHRYGIDGERIDDDDQDDRPDDAQPAPALDRRCPHGRPRAADDGTACVRCHPAAGRWRSRVDLRALVAQTRQTTPERNPTS